MDKNLYNILGVNKNSSDKEIKQAYRKLMFKYHPDTNNGDISLENKCKEINEAYDTLGDPAKRKQYDLQSQNPLFGMMHGAMPGAMHGAMHGGAMSGAMSGAMPGAMPGDFPLPPELFELFTGGMFGGEMPSVFHMGVGGLGGMNGMGGVKVHQMSSKPPPINKELEISLEEAFTGKTKQLSITRTILNGSTRNLEKETLYINIPQGIDSHEIITIKDKGNIVNNDIKGDVKVVIKVSNNSKFKRQGVDLVYDKQISLRESLCGFTFEMDYIDGRSFKINNDAGNVISSGHEKVVPNMGMTRENNTGDLIIKFHVNFPKTLTSDKIAKLKDIL